MSFFSGSINVDFLPLYLFIRLFYWARFRMKAFCFCFLLCARTWFRGWSVEDDDSMNKQLKIMLSIYVSPIYESPLLLMVT